MLDIDLILNMLCLQLNVGGVQILYDRCLQVPLQLELGFKGGDLRPQITITEPLIRNADFVAMAVKSVPPTRSRTCSECASRSAPAASCAASSSPRSCRICSSSCSRSAPVNGPAIGGAAHQR